MRIPVLLLSAFFTSTSVVIAQECGAPPGYTENLIAESEIEKASKYIVIATQQNKKLIIVGDVIKIDREHFPFLFPATSTPTSLPEIELQIQGRSVIFPDPLRLKTGKVEILADNVSFIGDGSISFTGSTRAGGDSLIVRATEIDLRRSSMNPFRYTSQQWGDPTSTSIRKTEVLTERIILPPLSKEDKVVYDVARPERLIRNLSNDRDAGQFSSWMKGYSVIIGENAQLPLKTLYNQDALWPNEQIAHVAEIFSSNPFDVKIRSWTENYLVSLQGRLIERKNTKALSRSMEIIQAVRNQTDLRGWSAFDVPFVSPGDIEADFEENRNRIMGKNGSLELWDESISQVYERRRDTREAIEKIKSDILEREKLLISLNQEIPNTIEQISAIDTKVGIQINVVRARLNELGDKIRKKERQIKQAKKINDVGNAIQVGAVVAGTLHPAAAPIAQASGQVLGIMAKAISDHNRGKTFGFSEAVNSFSELEKIQSNYESKFADLRTAWKTVDKKYIATAGKIGAVIDLTNSTFSTGPSINGTLRSEIELSAKHKDFVGSLGLPISTNIMMSSMASNDSELQSRISALSLLQLKAGELRNKLDTDLAKRSANVAQITDANTNLDDLTRPDPVANGQAMLERLSSALWLRQRTIDELRSRALVLIRSYSYRSGNTIELPKSLWQSINMMPGLNENLDEIFKQADDIRPILARSRQTISDSFLDLSSQIGLAKIKLRERDLPSPPLISRIDINPISSRRSKLQANFLKQVNQSIRDQIINNEKAVEIDLPLEVAVDDAYVPERVVFGQVEDVQFDHKLSLNGLTIRFSLEHEGWGVVYHDRKCSLVRGVGLDGQPMPPYRWQYDFPRQTSGADQALRSLTSARQLNNDFTFVYPFRTTYKIKAQVSNRSQILTSVVPIVKSMRVLIVGDERTNVGVISGHLQDRQ